MSNHVHLIGWCRRLLEQSAGDAAFAEHLQTFTLTGGPVVTGMNLQRYVA